MILKSMEAFYGFEKKVIGRLSILLFVIATVIVIAEVVTRYLFRYSFMGANETVTYLTACGAFLYFGLTEEGTGHLRVTLLLQAFRKGPAKKIITLVADLCGIFYCLLCAGLTARMTLMFYRNKVVSLNAELPMWIFYAVLCIGFVLLFIRLLSKLIVTIKTPSHALVTAGGGLP